MDITILFKACVKTVRTTNKSLGLNNNNNNTKSDLLKDVSKKDVHLIRAREVVRQISGFKKILEENKAAYLNVLNYLSTNRTMSEVDRENIDNAAEKIINSCSVAISELKKDIFNERNSKQKREHYEVVIESLEKYLKSVSKSYTEIKARRVKRVIDTHKISKLETNKVATPVLNANVEVNKSTSDLENRTDNSPNNKFGKPPSTPPAEDLDSQLSAEELQMFQSENELLYNELNSLSDEVRQIESKVVHIAELQELFTEKVLQQDRDIERIATSVVSATDNMRDANEQIRQAIQRNAGLRVWILFFLLVMSFSLLFLDWYND